jgi:hypothetical protein
MVPNCAICGTSLAGRRRDALCCGPACRRERSRLKRLLSGREAEGYRCLSGYLARRQRRAKPA